MISANPPNYAASLHGYLTCTKFTCNAFMRMLLPHHDVLHFVAGDQYNNQPADISHQDGQLGLYPEN